MIARKCIAFLKDERGAHAIEMAFIIPPLFLMIMSALEFGLIMYSSSLLDTLTAQAARFGKTGYDYGNGVDQTFTGEDGEGFNPGDSDDHYSVDENGTVTMKSREAFIRQYVRNSGGALLRPNHLRVTTELFENIGDAGITGVSATPYNFGAGSQAVVYTVHYDWPILTPLLLFVGEDGFFPIASSVVVKNESF